MTGELFDISDNILKVVSLDGHRISIRKVPLKKSVADRKLVVPGKTLIEISKILSGEAENVVSISYTKNHIVFEFDNTIVVSRLIEGEYFRIDQMLSNDYETRDYDHKRGKRSADRIQSEIPDRCTSCYRRRRSNNLSDECESTLLHQR